MIKKIVFTLLSLLLFNKYAVSQNNCNICSIALASPNDEIQTYSNYELLEELHRIYTLDERNYRKEQSKKKSRFFLYEFGTGDFKKDKATVEKAWKSIKEKNDFTRNEKALKFMSRKIGNEKAYDTFVECLKICNSSTEGVVFPIYRQLQGGRRIRLIIKNNKYNGAKTNFSIVKDELYNLTILREDSLSDAIYPSIRKLSSEQHIFSFTRPNPKCNALLVLKIDGKLYELDISGIKERQELSRPEKVNISEDELIINDENYIPPHTNGDTNLNKTVRMVFKARLRVSENKDVLFFDYNYYAFESTGSDNSSGDGTSYGTRGIDQNGEHKFDESVIIFRAKKNQEIEEVIVNKTFQERFAMQYRTEGFGLKYKIKLPAMGIEATVVGDQGSGKSPYLEKIEFLKKKGESIIKIDLKEKYVKYVNMCDSK